MIDAAQEKRKEAVTTRGVAPVVSMSFAELPVTALDDGRYRGEK